MKYYWTAVVYQVLWNYYCTAVLFCTVVYCWTELYWYTVLLYCRVPGTVLLYALLHRSILYCIVLVYHVELYYCTVLYCTVLYFTVPYCTVLYCSTVLARRASAHARNYRGCMTRIIGKSRLQMRQYCQGVRTLQVNWVWIMKRKKALESDAMNHSKIFCHPAHDDERQQQHTTYVVQQRTTQ